MLKKYIKIKRGYPYNSSYIQPLTEIVNAIDGEFDGAEIGEKLILELIEMEEDEYKKLPEFIGW